mgnify:CR=1 FL=1
MEENFWFWVFIICAVVGIGFGITSCVWHENTPEYKAVEAVRIKTCETPSLVSEIDGVRLYVVSPNCDRAVYFSKSGTHTTHSEIHGKTSREYDDDVPAGK